VEIDRLKLYFGEPYVVNDKITIRQPSIGEILDYGEKDFYNMLRPFVANTTSYRLRLWDAGVDWNKITDYELFSALIGESDVDQTSILFGDLNFKLLKKYTARTDDKTEYTLYDPENDIEINEETYNNIALYLRTMFNIFPKVEKAKGKTTKEAIIEEDRMNYELHKNDEYTSDLLPLISSCLNHPGFKYKKNELRDVGIVEFMDGVKRLQVYESTNALLKGMYSGMVDVSKINKDEFNFMREIK